MIGNEEAGTLTKTVAKEAESLSHEEIILTKLDIKLEASRSL
jgi:hypothetical protein